MLKPISGNSPAKQAQSLGNGIQALRQAPAKAGPKAAPQDSAEISDTGKAAVASAGRMLREQMTRATA